MRCLPHLLQWILLDTRSYGGRLKQEEIKTPPELKSQNKSNLTITRKNRKPGQSHFPSVDKTEQRKDNIVLNLTVIITTCSFPRFFLGDQIDGHGKQENPTKGLVLQMYA